MGNLNKLPLEIMLDILTRLPAESVLESKLVCKPWRSLVQQPSFSQLHLNHLHSSVDNSSKLSMIICSREKEFYYAEYDDDNVEISRKTRLNLSPEFQKCNIIGSCNGLICFNAWLDGHRGPGFICNPITRECITLPNREGWYMWSGFGYSSLTNEYKVIRIRLRWTGPVFGYAQVYTVGDGNGWRSLGEMDVKWEPMHRVATSVGAFVNGALHWVNLDNGAILAFDLTNEKFSELPSPPCFTPDFPIYLGVLGDVLSAMEYQDGYRSKPTWLLKKNEDNSEWSWSKQFSFDKCVQMPFEFTKSGRILWHGLDGGIYIHDPKIASTITDTITDTGFRISIIGAVPHKNTLVSLKSLGEKHTNGNGNRWKCKIKRGKRKKHRTRSKLYL